MERILWDFNKTSGRIKPLNAVNNGPTLPGVRSTKTGSTPLFKTARFPYARNHDASHYTPYGGEHIVDVHRIFKNFSADENDPASYWFEPTDAYLKATTDAGTKVFYRLGASIEHYVKYGTIPPKDYKKWARICEHIIMHYTKGWADGFHYDIEYWEIWNEPDCHNRDGSNPCWQGTDEEFTEFYITVSKYLKSRFPHLKIGGPAFCTIWRNKEWFLKEIKKANAPLDFFSYHWYGATLEKFSQTLKEAQRQLEATGFSGTPTILNEWNYVRGWIDEEWKYSLNTEKNLKGASFVLGAMCLAQDGPLDMLMYYDARPCGMNGLFDISTYEPLKPFYSFVMFADLKDTGDYVRAEKIPEDIYTCASNGENEASVIVTYFNDNDDGFYDGQKIADREKEISLEFRNLFIGEKIKVQIYLTDEEKDNALVKEMIMDEEKRTLNLKIGLYCSFFIKITKE